MTRRDHDKERDALRQLVTPPADAMHLDADSQLIPYVDGELDEADREVVESHLEDCTLCRAEVDDLRAFREPAVRRGRTFARFVAAFAAGIVLLLAIAIVSRRQPEPVPPATTAEETSPPVTSMEVKPAARDPKWAALVAETVARRRLPYPDDLDELTSPNDVLRGHAKPASTVSPAGIVVDDARPRFSWPAVEGATYVVAVLEGDEVVARSPVLEVEQWRPDRLLRRGRTYTWQVTATRDGTKSIIPAPPAPAARFRIVDDAAHRALHDALAAAPRDRLLHAILYARAGLRENAEAALREAAAAGDRDAAALVRNAGGQ